MKIELTRLYRSGCHSEPFEIDYDGVQTETHELLDSLHTLLVDRGWITASGSS